MLLKRILKRSEDFIPLTHSEDEFPDDLISLKITSLPKTLELKNRQFEEELRKRLNIPKEKLGRFL